nr:hypothetical protein Q903MT_gene6616 [Picea sitchensis]
MMPRRVLSSYEGDTPLERGNTISHSVTSSSLVGFHIPNCDLSDLVWLPKLRRP